MITQERENLQRKRQKQEDELEKILDTSAMEIFGNSQEFGDNPMITPQLKQKLDKKRKDRQEQT